MVTVLVGKAETKFVFHKGILCVQSGFFDTAFKKELMTTEDQYLRLPEDDPEVFRASFYWIYRNRIIIPEAVFDKGPHSLKAKLWLLADFYQVNSLQNDAIDGIISYHQKAAGLSVEVMNIVYDNAFQLTCGLRKLLARIAEQQYEADDMDPEKTNFSHEFLLDMVRRGLQYPMPLVTREARTKIGFVSGNTWKTLHAKPG